MIGPELARRGLAAPGHPALREDLVDGRWGGVLAFGSLGPDLRGDERLRSGPRPEAGSDDLLAAPVVGGRVDDVDAEVEGGVPNHPAKPIAPNPSTLSSSPAAGNSGTASEVQDESGDRTSATRRSSCSRWRPARPRRARSRGGRARPRATAVSQVPQVPSAHEDSTATPASSTMSRIDRSGGTVRSARSGRARPRRRRCAPARSTGLAANRSTCRDAARPRRAVPLDGGQQRLGAAAVDEGVRPRGAEQARQVEQPGLVLRATVTPGRRRRRARRGRPSTRAAGRRRRSRHSAPAASAAAIMGRIGVMPMPPAMNR